ncbi:MAG TPA: hypothetical protein VL494_06980 [Steroidobacteraceae bacterium]|jgi:hypothetical protein|nr:hypothetical protein [Steroidobacteraceae bacterium]
MDDTQLWAIFWKCAAVTLSVIAISTASCTAHQDYVQTQALAKSANPAALQCGFAGKEAQTTAFCAETAKH